MSAVVRLFEEWWGDEGSDLVGNEHIKDDVFEGFQAGWVACYHAHWEPVGGLPDSPDIQS